MKTKKRPRSFMNSVFYVRSVTTDSHRKLARYIKDIQNGHSFIHPVIKKLPDGQIIDLWQMDFHPMCHIASHPDLCLRFFKDSGSGINPFDLDDFFELSAFPVFQGTHERRVLMYHLVFGMAFNPLWITRLPGEFLPNIMSAVTQAMVRSSVEILRGEAERIMSRHSSKLKSRKKKKGKK